MAQGTNQLHTHMENIKLVLTAAGTRSCAACEILPVLVICSRLHHRGDPTNQPTGRQANLLLCKGA